MLNAATSIVVALYLHAREDGHLGGILDIFRSNLNLGACSIRQNRLIEMVFFTGGNEVRGPCLPRLSRHSLDVIE